MKNKEYKSQCCNALIKVGGLPDFLGDKYPCTIYHTCTKCGKPCNIKGVKKVNKKLEKSIKRGIKDIEEGEITKIDNVDKMFEEFEEERREHPVYYFFHAIYWRTYHFADSIPLRIRTFIQRGKRGWANSDTWGFDYYLSKVISEGVYNLKEHIHGMPNNLTEGQWIDILNKIIYTFELAHRMTKDELYLIENKKQRKKWQKTLDEINKKHKSRDRCMTSKEIREYEEGWKLFKEYFFNLWD